MQTLLASSRTRAFMRGALLLAIIGTLLTAFALAARAAEAPSIATTALNASNATTTSATIGSNIHAYAAVSTASTTLPTPTGTVDFLVYPNTTCSGSAATQTGVALVNGVAISSATSLGVAGLSYKVHYNGQGDVFTTADGTCTPVTATSANVTIGTTLSTTTAQAGSLAHDSAVLTGETGDAGGTVAYAVFTDSSCSTQYATAGTMAVTNGTVPDSFDLQFNTPGSYYWRAVYSGDSHNSTATSTCANELLTIVATTTQLGHIVVDKQTNPANDGTSFSFTTTGAGYSGFSLTDAATPNTQNLAAGTYTVNESSVSGWTLTSASCSKNNAATTTYTPGAAITLAANDTVRCVFVNTKNVVAGNGTISGMVYKEINDNEHRDAGEPGLQGWKINLYKGTGWWKGGKSPIMTVTSAADGTYSFTGLADGTYSVEEVITKGWKQVTSDYKSVVIAGNNAANLDFGNIEKSNNGNHGKSKHFNFPWNGFHFNWGGKGDNEDDD